MKSEKASEINLALPRLVVPDGFGINIHFTGNPRFEELRLSLDGTSFFESGSYETDYNIDLDLIAEAGFKFIRMDMCWGAVEMQKGVYDFEKCGYNALTEGCVKRGIRIIYILDYSNKLYESDTSVRTEQGRKAFAAFAKIAAEKYKGHGIIWEVWNEPNVHFWKPEPNAADYCKLVEVTAPAIKQGDTAGIVAGPALSKISKLDYLEDCFKNGLLKWIDVVSVHPYQEHNVNPPEVMIEHYTKLRQLIQRYVPAGKKMPFISGEWGYPCDRKTGVTEDQQAQILVRIFLMNLWQGIPVSIWYDWRNDGSDPMATEYNFGTVTHDLKPKPAYIAAKTLIHTLKGYSIEKRIDLGSKDDFALKMTKGKSQAIVFWTIAEEHEVILPIKVAEGSLINLAGSKTAISWKTNELKLRTTTGPQYLLIEKG